MTQTTKRITAARIQLTEESLVIELADRNLEVPWENCSPRLAEATPKERLQAELSLGGYGIHWPLLDEDLSIAGLVASADS